MKNFGNIDEFLNGNLKGWELELFEQEMNKSKKFHNMVNVYQSVNKSMKVLMMVEDAEQEMYSKGIDKLAYDLVKDWYIDKANNNGLKGHENLFLS